MLETTKDPTPLPTTAAERPLPAPAPAHEAAGHDDADEDHGFDPTDPIFQVKAAPTSFALVIAGAIVVGLALVFAIGIVPRQRIKQEIAALAREQDEVVKVSVTSPRKAAPLTELTLPATVRANQETAIYARANGFLKRWIVDMGDHVEAGQLLAEIEVPELEQQIDQAKAALNQVRARLVLAEANVGLAESTLKRYETAAPAGGITPQELDEKRAGVDVARATRVAAQADVAASEASVRRLIQLLDFAQVRAPFAGTITGRWVDVGSLVMTGNTKGQELFHLVQTNPARVMVNVPQANAPAIDFGSAAEVIVREHPGQTFQGKVARTTRSIDDMTRTLLVDVEVPNEKALLLAGSYAQVKFHLTQERPALLIPQSALVITADGTQVALVRDDGRLHFQTVQVDVDYGNELALGGGLTEKDRIVTNPSEKLVEGLAVKAVSVTASGAGDQKPAR